VALRLTESASIPHASLTALAMRCSNSIGFRNFS
jgi:hypothetical protein